MKVITPPAYDARFEAYLDHEKVACDMNGDQAIDFKANNPACILKFSHFKRVNNDAYAALRKQLAQNSLKSQMENLKVQFYAFQFDVESVIERPQSVGTIDNLRKVIAEGEQFLNSARATLINAAKAGV
jgi:hypothetical protein